MMEFDTDVGGAFISNVRPPTGPSLVGPLDLDNITLERLPAILTRFADKIEAVDGSLRRTIDENKMGHRTILDAIESMKLSNNKIITDFQCDIGNAKTIVKFFSFAVDHPWLSVAGSILGFAALDFTARFTYWHVWPK